MAKLSRRDLLIRSSLGMGSVQLRSLVTGLPVPFLIGLANRTLAQELSDPRYLVISHLQAADPVGANAPGTYADDPNDSNDPLNMIEHPVAAELAATPATQQAALGFETPSTFNLGNVEVKAAAPWATLDEDLRANMAFWHHGTFTNAHPDFPAVRRFNGAIKGYDGSGSDELDATIAQETNQALGTLLEEPISVGGTRISYGGRELPILKPTDIQALFASSITNIDQMVQLRDGFIDRAYRTVKDDGTPAQKAFLEKYARSRSEAIEMGDSLGELITDIDGDDAANQAKMAVALLQLNLSPVITIGIPFGGDNHQDINLANEVDETTAAMPAINTLWQELKAANLHEKTIISSLNTFGRTLKRNATGGRNHNGRHHTMFVIGTNIKPGVIGGIEPENNNRDFIASAFSSTTGLTTGSTDIPYDETLVAAGKTLSKALGISEERINQRFDGGKIISAALKS